MIDDRVANPSYFSDEELSIESENDIELTQSFAGLKKSHVYNIIIKIVYSIKSIIWTTKASCLCFRR